MKRKFLFGSAAALALAAGSAPSAWAQAEGTPPPAAPAPNADTQGSTAQPAGPHGTGQSETSAPFSGQPFYMNGSFYQYVPGTGFVPLNTGPVTVLSGYGGVPAYGSGYGAPYFPGFNPGILMWSGGPLYSGRIVAPQVVGQPLFPMVPQWRGPRYVGNRSRVTYVPVVPVVPVTPAPANPAPNGNPATAQAGNADAAPGSQAVQEALADRMGRIMEERPLIGGTAVSVGATGVLVRYELRGEEHTERFPMDQVFFFRSNGDLATAALAPELLVEGADVLIPQPGQVSPRGTGTPAPASREEARPAAPRSSVAGSRSTVGGTSTRKPAAPKKTPKPKTRRR